MRRTGPLSLTFFVELAATQLTRLIDDHVLDGLQRCGAGVAIAMLDCTDERAEVLRLLAARKIPTSAWLVLDRADGYWLGADNAAKARDRYRQVRQWLECESLSVESIGLDVELPHRDAVAIARHGARAMLRLLRRRRSHRAIGRAVEQYAHLQREIRADGFTVETYQYPLIVDERRACSTLSQRTLGIVDLVPDREVLMLYSSLLPRPFGPLLVDAYGPAADAIAVGVTGGGVEELPFDGRLLGFRQLLDDLRAARRYTDQLYIFSLEGCITRNTFQPLCEAVQAGALDEPPGHYPLLAPIGSTFRALLRTALRAGDRIHPINPLE